MDYMLIPLKGEPPYRVFENQETPDAAIEYAAIMAPSQGEIKIWQAVMLVRLKPDIIDLTIPVVPEPPRRGRPRKAEKPPEPPCPLPLPKALPDPPYRLDILKPPLVIDSCGCEQDLDGVYRACIVYTRDGVTGSAIGKHDESEVEATWQALHQIGIMHTGDLEALPDTEGKRQLLAALGAKATD